MNSPADVINNRVQNLRLEMGKTQEELGKVVGVTRQTIIAIEKNNYEPSLKLALKISKHFGLPLESVFWLK